MRTMTKLRSIALALAFALTLGACEETVDITDATYRERMVIHAVLDPVDSVDITITRTLPINRPYDAAEAALSDVAGTLTIVDPAAPGASRQATLVHVGNGHYTARLADRAVVPKEGFEYRLDISWRGRSARARTIVPRSATVDSVTLVPSSWSWEGRPMEMFSVRAVIDPNPGEVYLLASTQLDSSFGEPPMPMFTSAPIARSRDTNAQGRIAMVDEWNAYSEPEGLAAVVVTYDEPYYEFQRTYYRGDDMGPFGSGSDIVRWTVEGDAIGLFIGRTTRIVPATHD